MPNNTREEFRDSLLRVHEEFGQIASWPKLRARLYELAKGYRDYRALSDDTWMSRSQLNRALRSIQSDLRRAKQTMDHPVLLRHLNINHPRRHNDRCTAQDLSEALSAVGWALTNLHEDYSSGSSGEHRRQRRTRTSTRDQYLIPQLTWMILDYSELDVEDPSHMEEVEHMIRVLLREWPIITGNAHAENYDKIAKKPLRRLIRAAAESHQPLREN